MWNALARQKNGDAQMPLDGHRKNVARWLSHSKSKSKGYILLYLSLLKSHGEILAHLDVRVHPLVFCQRMRPIEHQIRQRLSVHVVPKRTVQSKLRLMWSYLSDPSNLDWRPSECQQCTLTYSSRFCRITMHIGTPPFKCQANSLMKWVVNFTKSASF